jgi:uncharacterized protein YhhL (DUF1145 family)
MNDQTTLKRMKIAVAATWIFSAASFFPPFSGFAFAGLGQSLFGILLAVHVIECAVFFPTLRASGRPLLGQLGQTMLFGVIHQRTLKLAEAEREEA